jgi:protein-S-isoprenylcysteine O-methyltransferase Ste14
VCRVVANGANAPAPWKSAGWQPFEAQGKPALRFLAYTTAREIPMPPQPSKISTAFILVKLGIFTFCVPGTVTVWAPLYWIFPWVRHAITRSSGLLALAALLLALGIAGYLWCALDFALRGRGTPFPADPPKVLVVRGLYKYVRNPMYISVLTILLGECALFASRQLLEYSAAIAVMFHLFVLIYEEPALRRQMGSAYEDYCRGVRRWIPRLTPRRVNHAV